MFTKLELWFSFDSWTLIFNDTRQDYCAVEVSGMSIKIESGFTVRFVVSLLTSAILVLGTSGVGLAAPGDDARTSVSRHFIKGGRTGPTQTADSEEEYEALVPSGDRGKSATRAGSSKPGAGSIRAESTGFDFWIYDVDIQLFNDDDIDGYYHGIDVLFDADTNFSVADIYAVMYLSYEGGPWNEYAVSEDFTIFGAGGSDEYVLVTELMSGYPTGSYDLLIELFDAYDGTFLADYGPNDSSAMGFLPLEDFNRDAPGGEVQIAVSQGGGGALEAWMLSVLVLLLIVRAIRKIWRHRNDALVRIDSPAPFWQDCYCRR